MAASDMSRADLLKKRKGIEYFSTTWHAVSALAAISFGISADSIALAGFGLDSIVQTAIGILAVWRVQTQEGGQIDRDGQLVEQKILFIQGVIFFLLALFILHEAGSNLFYREKPGTSIPGLVFSVLSAGVLCVLAFVKGFSARAVQSDPGGVREALCRVYLSLALFFGLLFNIIHGWWWADPLAGLFMVPFIIREGWKAVDDSKASPYTSEA